jgi:hypothetical protein
MKASELTGAALDWAVAKCEPDDTLAIYFDESTGEPLCHDDWPNNQEYKPSTDWAQGGPIIEREKIAIDWDGAAWCASDNVNPIACYGPTLLTAAMRCYVASKLGDEVDVPEELNHD